MFCTFIFEQVVSTFSVFSRFTSLLYCCISPPAHIDILKCRNNCATCFLSYIFICINAHDCRIILLQGATPVSVELNVLSAVPKAQIAKGKLHFTIKYYSVEKTKCKLLFFFYISGRILSYSVRVFLASTQHKFNDYSTFLCSVPQCTILCVWCKKGETNSYIANKFYIQLYLFSENLILPVPMHLRTRHCAFFFRLYIYAQAVSVWLFFFSSTSFLATQTICVCYTIFIRRLQDESSVPFF